jgi:hypothetical protein
MVNRTFVHMPEPTKSERVVVKQTPGYGYPKAVDHVRIVERAGGCTKGAACADGVCDNSQQCPNADPNAAGQPCEANQAKE